MIVVSSKDFWEEDYTIRVNTVNCVGVMGKGIALEFKNRYPAMFDLYRSECQLGKLKPGLLMIWKAEDTVIINFPTKIHWKDRSKLEWIDSGLKSLSAYLKLHPYPIAIPALGCSNGGLDWKHVFPLMLTHLGKLNSEVFVFPPKVI